MALKYSFVLNTVHYAVYKLRVDRKIVFSIALVFFLLNGKNTDHFSTVNNELLFRVDRKFIVSIALIIFILNGKNTDHFSTVYYYSELIESLLFR